MGTPLPIGEGVWEGALPRKIFQFWGLERRILVHSVALLSADCTAAFCTVIYSADAIIALIRYVNAPYSWGVTSLPLPSPPFLLRPSSSLRSRAPKIQLED